VAGVTYRLFPTYHHYHHLPLHAFCLSRRAGIAYGRVARFTFRHLRTHSATPPHAAALSSATYTRARHCYYGRNFYRGNRSTAGALPHSACRRRRTCLARHRRTFCALRRDLRFYTATPHAGTTSVSAYPLRLRSGCLTPTATLPYTAARAPRGFAYLCVLSRLVLRTLLPPRCTR